jgi:hypothetical protein
MVSVEGLSIPFDHLLKGITGGAVGEVSTKPSSDHDPIIINCRMIIPLGLRSDCQMIALKLTFKSDMSLDWLTILQAKVASSNPFLQNLSTNDIDMDIDMGMYIVHVFSMCTCMFKHIYIDVNIYMCLQYL